MNNYIEKAKQDGLLDVILEWINNEKYLSISTLQRTFSIGFPYAKSLFEYLISEGYVESEPTYNKGNKIIQKPCKSQLKIVILDLNKEITNCLKDVFDGYENVEIVNGELTKFLKNNEIECIVSPGNSFGMMDGGYDRAIIDYFGIALENEVQKYIKENYFNEQPVGTSFIINIPKTNKRLIHTPTMRIPSIIKDPMIVYQCMRTTLACALKANVKSILIPAFGGATGKVEPELIAKYMKAGYEQIFKNIG